MLNKNLLLIYEEGAIYIYMYIKFI